MKISLLLKDGNRMERLITGESTTRKRGETLCGIRDCPIVSAMDSRNVGINKISNTKDRCDTLNLDKIVSKHSLGSSLFPAFDWKISETHP